MTDASRLLVTLSPEELAAVAVPSPDEIRAAMRAFREQMRNLAAQRGRRR